MEVGRAVAEVLAASPWRVALIASSSWSHCFLSPTNGYLWPDHKADRLMFDALSAGAEFVALGAAIGMATSPDPRALRLAFGVFLAVFAAVITHRALGRYAAKILSAMILLLGFLMIAWTRRKQGLHDMLANTLVLNGRASAFREQPRRGDHGSFHA